MRRSGACEGVRFVALKSTVCASILRSNTGVSPLRRFSTPFEQARREPRLAPPVEMTRWEAELR